MRVLIIGFDFMNYTDSITKAFQDLGHQARKVSYIDFFQRCNLFEKKIDQVGVAVLLSKISN